MCSADQTTRSANVWYLLSYLLRWIFNRREEVAAGDKSRLEEGERWIVITSINYPTPSVERLNELPGWQVALQPAAMFKTGSLSVLARSDSVTPFGHVRLPINH